MGLFYTNEHTSCYNYMKEEDATFRYMELRNGVKINKKEIEKSALVFVLTGRISFSCNQFLNREIKAGEIGLLPVGCSVQGAALEDSSLVVCVFYLETNLCNRYSMKMLASYSKEIVYDFHLLTFAGEVGPFMDLLVAYLRDGINCSHLQEWKKNELFLLFRAYYSKEELAQFFCPIIGENLNFRDLILKNASSVNNVEDLAKRLNYSVSSFKRHFVKHFGVSPYQWQQGQKASRIYQEIKLSDKSFMELSMEFGFSSQQHFSRFCKEQFGTTAKMLRADKDL